MRKQDFCKYAKTKLQISYAVAAQLIRAFVFTKKIVQSLNLLYPKFQASNQLNWLCNTLCVRLGQKPQSLFSYVAGSHNVSVPKVNDTTARCLSNSVLPRDICTLVKVYLALPVFTSIAGTSYAYFME